MIYKSFQKLTLSSLGFGTMRLPLQDDGTIDQKELDRMTDMAIAGGVNYFDTAHPYHGGKSEAAIGRSLARYDRDSWYLADKFPGHQNVHGVRELQPKDVFEEQLRRCGVEFFDFYLLHNVNENSMQYYCNPEKRCLEYFLEQKEKGRIRHLGFSCHAGPDALRQFVREYGRELEFCQIQLNYVDWTLQDAKQKTRSRSATSCGKQGCPSGGWSRSAAENWRPLMPKRKKRCALFARMRVRRPGLSAGCRRYRSRPWS